MKPNKLSCWLAAALLSGVVSHAIASNEVIEAYERGDFATVLKEVRPNAERGDARAQVMMGRIYRLGQGVAKDPVISADWYLKAAKQGAPIAQVMLGIYYETGVGVEKNEKEAIAWYQKAADQNDPGGQYNLGLFYKKKDDYLAFQLIRKAAENGYDLAQFELGNLFLEGKGGINGAVTAFGWFLKAAEQGFVLAQGRLGSMYSSGQGTSKDEKKAVFWYKKAAEQGNVFAQNNLGLLYSEGTGVIKDDAQAAMWYRRAAEQGSAIAQYNLGLLYLNGEGVAKDFQQAYFWWLLASADGNGGAIKNRNVVEQMLSIEQRNSAQAAARTWLPKSDEQASLISKKSESVGAPKTQVLSTVTQPNSTGSGFRIAQNAFVTNNHVVDGCRQLSINGKSAMLRASDARSDLAILSGSVPGPYTSLRAQRATVGEPLLVAGYPLRGVLSGFNLTTGNLSSMSGMGGDTRLIQITAPVQPGNSGGPALDTAGNLVGVVVSKLDALKAAKLTGDIPQNVNFAINVNILRSFLDANNVPYETVSSSKILPNTVIAEKAKEFTVLIECWN